MKIQVLCSYPWSKEYYFMCAEPIDNTAQIDGRYMWVRDGKECKRRGKKTIPAFMFSDTEMLCIFQTTETELRQLGYKPCKVSFSHIMSKNEADTIIANDIEVESPLYTAPNSKK